MKLIAALLVIACLGCSPRVLIPPMTAQPAHYGADLLRYETRVRLIYTDDVFGMHDTVLIAMCIRPIIGGGYRVLPKTGSWVECRDWRPE